MSMSSSRPYMIRALHEWIVDNECTPHVAVDAFQDGVQVPQDFVQDGQIVLNISPFAVRDLVFGDQMLIFNARFGGIPTDIEVPYSAILGIYAKENGQGMMFEPETSPEPPEPTKPRLAKKPSASSDKSHNKKSGAKPNLRVVK